MIINFTVNDNEFGDLLEEFGTNLLCKVTNTTYGLLESSNVDSEKLYGFYKITQRLLNMAASGDYSPDNKQLLLERVRVTFYSFIRNKDIQEKFDIDESTVKYLFVNFKIKLLKSFTDRWQNGKEIYFEKLRQLGFTDVTYRKSEGCIILENHTKGEK